VNLDQDVTPKAGESQVADLDRQWNSVTKVIWRSEVSGNCRAGRQRGLVVRVEGFTMRLAGIY